MKRIFLIFCILAPIIISAGKNMTPEEAKEMATRRYVHMKNTVDNCRVAIVKHDYVMMYGNDENGKPIYDGMKAKYPNDLIYFTDNKYQLIKPRLFFEGLAEVAKKHKDKNNPIHFEYYYLNGEPFINPKMSNDEESSFYKCVFKKRWTVDGETYTINDTVQVNLQYGNIPRIYSGIIYEREDIKNKREDIKNNNKTSEDIRETELNMIADAVYYYDKGDYVKAADLYSKITQEYPDNAEAWYAYGVMWWKHGNLLDRNIDMTGRKQAALYCFCMAKGLPKAKRAIEKITDGRYTMDNCGKLLSE